METTDKIPDLPPPRATAEAQYQDAVALLGAVRKTVTTLLLDLQSGTGGDLTETVKKQRELETALGRVFDAEQKYYEWYRKHGGYDPADIDYDAIRDQIGCRLDRIRACCREG
jgi:hypothetical protein